MKVFPVVLGLMLAAGACCCGDMLEGLGVPMPSPGGDVPAALAGFEVYPGAQFQAGAKVGSVSSANFEVPGAAPTDIVNFYKGQFVEDGYTIGVDYADATTATVQGSKGSAKATATATTQGDKVWLVLGLQE